MIDTQKLRQRILDLAIRGKLVPQDPNDEPASVLLERIRAEKERLIAEGKIKRPKKAKSSSSESHYQNFTPPFDIPESWAWVQVGNISSSILYGISESAKVSGKYKLLRITDIQDNTVEWKNVPCTDFDDNKASQYLLKDGDIVFARTGATVGKSYLVEGAPSNAIYASYLIRIQTVGDVLPNYLKLFFESGFYWQQIYEGAVGIGQPNVNGTSLGLLWLPIPPKAEQMRIVSSVKVLSTIISDLEQPIIKIHEDIISAKSKILELAMQGKLVPQDSADEPAAEMLKRINPKAKIIADNPHYPKLPDNWVLTDINSVCDYGRCDTISVENINDNDWILELEDIQKNSGVVIEKKLKNEREVKGVRHSFNQHDILYSKLRTYLNKVLIASTEGYCSTEIIPIHCQESIIPEYLCAWLRSPYFLSYTQSCGYGVKMPRLSTFDAKNGIVPLPPLEEQKRIMEQVNSLFGVLDSIANSVN